MHGDLAGHRGSAREGRQPGPPARAGQDGPRHGCVRLGGRGWAARRARGQHRRGRRGHRGHRRLPGDGL
eukprot:8494536-Alexandrium_andersonii.AAC.1